MGFGCVTRWEGMTDLVMGLREVFAQEACDCALCIAYLCLKHEAVELIRDLLA